MLDGSMYSNGVYTKTLVKGVAGRMDFSSSAAVT